MISEPIPSRKPITKEMLPQILLNRDTGDNPVILTGPYAGKEQKPFSSFVALHRFNEKKEVEFLVIKYRDVNGNIQCKFPGGGSEKGENPLDTAIREVFEETLIQKLVLKELQIVPLEESGVMNLVCGSDKVANMKLFFAAEEPLQNFEIQPRNKNLEAEVVEVLWMSAKDVGVKIYGDHKTAFKESVKMLTNRKIEYYYAFLMVA